MPNFWKKKTHCPGHSEFEAMDINPHWMSFINGVTNSAIGFYCSFENPLIRHEHKKLLRPMALFLAVFYAFTVVLMIPLLPFVLLASGPFLQLLTLIPYWSFLLAQKWAPHATSKIFMIELARIDKKMAEQLNCTFQSPLNRSWPSEIWQDIRKSWHFSKYSIILLVCSFIPFIGNAISSIGQILLVADRLGWNLFSVYTVNSQHMSYNEQKQWMQDRRWAILGFTLPLTILISIPFAGPFFLGFAQAAAAHLFCNIFCDKKLIPQTPDQLDSSRLFQDEAFSIKGTENSTLTERSSKKSSEYTETVSYVEQSY